MNMNGDFMNKYELHAHTKEGDLYAEFNGAQIVHLYKNAGYDGIVITNHYFSLFFEWFKNEMSVNDHKKIIDRYLRGYYSAKNEGEKNGFTVLCGAEVRLDNEVNDYLIYGLRERDFYELPLLNQVKNLRALTELLPEYALIVQAHPFRNKMVVCDPSILFGIEGYNGCNEEFRNEMAKYYASHYGKSVTSGSDFHNMDQLAKGGIATMKKICNSDDLVNVLCNGQYVLIEDNAIIESDGDIIAFS